MVTSYTITMCLALDSNFLLAGRSKFPPTGVTRFVIWRSVLKHLQCKLSCDQGHPQTPNDSRLQHHVNVIIRRVVVSFRERRHRLGFLMKQCEQSVNYRNSGNGRVRL